MKRLWSILFFLIGTIVFLSSSLSQGEDWPGWGKDGGRNMAGNASGLPVSFDSGSRLSNGDLDMATTRNVKWAAHLGTKTYGNPVVSGGKVFIGTNDTALKDDRLRKTRGGMILCLDEKTGKRLWQMPVPRYVTSDREFNYDDMNLGICAAATVEENRLYVVTNRGEVLCLDTNGQADGNDGPFVDEGKFMVGSKQPSVKVRKDDGDIIWCFDMIAELPVWPQDASSGAVLILGDHLYVNTSNGVDRSHYKVPYPQAPSLIVLDKTTGRLVAKDDERIGERLFHGQWSSPATGIVDGKTLVFYGGGDGLLYAFEPAKPSVRKKPATLKKVWMSDCNPPEYKIRDGKEIPYQRIYGTHRTQTRGDGPSEIIATPVFYQGRVYVSVGQDTRHGKGKGALSCIDARNGKLLWQSKQVERTLSTVSIADGLLYVADYSGKVRCFDALKGTLHWEYDAKSFFWSSTFVADGKVYIGTEDKEFLTLKAGKKLELLGKSKAWSPFSNTAVSANGTLFVASQNYLFAL